MTYKSKLGEWKVVSTKLNHSDVGDLYYFEKTKEIKFSIDRIYYITNVPKQIIRGNHAHFNLEQAIFCIHGELKITLENAMKREDIILKPLHDLLIISGLVWREIEFSNPETVAVIAASETYDESDYIRAYSDFVKIKEQQI